MFLCWFLFLFLCYSLFCLFSLVFCHRVCACFHFFVVGVFHLYSIYGKNSTNDNCFAPIIMVTLTYLSVYEIYKKHKNCPNYMQLLHHEICELLKIEYVTVNRVSLLFKVKSIAGLKDKIRSINVRNVNRKLKKNQENIKKN